jgi:hypothetical protein
LQEHRELVYWEGYNMLSVGMNRKLGKDVGVFNLPARKTCPGKTKYCGKVCYAMKAERMYKGARESRVRNYKASKLVGFQNNMTEELIKFATNGGKQIRIHESGDFYNQGYLNKWMLIATSFPKITFLAYTKMFDKLDFSVKPDNMIVYASLDPSSFDKLGDVPDNLHASLIVEDVKDAPIGWYVCKPISQTGHHNYCGKSCKICWKGERNAVWIKH